MSHSKRSQLGRILSRTHSTLNCASEYVHLMRGLQSNTKGDRECAVRTPPLPTSIVMDVCGVWLATIFFILLTKSVRVRACFRNRWTSHRCQAIHFEAHKGDISRSLQCKSDADGKIHLENSKFFVFFDRKMKGNSTSVDVTVSAFTFNIHSARQLLLIHSTSVLRLWKSSSHNHNAYPFLNVWPKKAKSIYFEFEKIKIVCCSINK